jgi:hypothetical protein
MAEERKTRIYLEISGGNLQNIVVDGEAEIVVVDYDNTYEDSDFTADSVEEMLEPTVHTGTAEEYEEQIATARTALEEVASKNAETFRR